MLLRSILLIVFLSFDAILIALPSRLSPDSHPSSPIFELSARLELEQKINKRYLNLPTNKINIIRKNQFKTNTFTFYQQQLINRYLVIKLRNNIRQWRLRFK